MGDELGRGFVRLERDQQGLHDLVAVTVGEVFKVIFRVAVDTLAAAAPNQMIGVQPGGLAGDDLCEIHLEFLRDLIDHADGDVLAVFFIGGIDLRAEVQLRSQLLDRIVADFPQLAQTRADLLIIIHDPYSFAVT